MALSALGWYEVARPGMFRRSHLRVARQTGIIGVAERPRPALYGDSVTASPSAAHSVVHGVGCQHRRRKNTGVCWACNSSAEKQGK